MHQKSHSGYRPRLRGLLVLLTVLAASGLTACGSGAPSDTQISRALVRDFKSLEKASLGLTRAALENIRIGAKHRMSHAIGTYEIEVTATVATRIGGINAVRPCTTTIKLKKINNRWTLVN